MHKLTFIALILLETLTLCQGLYCQGYRVDGLVQNQSGRPQPGASIAVCTQPVNTSIRPCTPLATLYTDSTFTVVGPNPVTADGLGNYHFYTGYGPVTLQFYGSGLTTYIMPDQSIPGSNVPKFSSQYPSLQAAVTDAGVGGWLIVDKSYTGLASLVLPRRIHLQGFGPQGIVSLAFTNLAGSTITVAGATGQDYVTIGDLAITGANAGTPVGLDLTNVGIVFLNRVVIRQFYINVLGNNSLSVHATDCNVSDALLDNYQLNGTSNAWRIRGGLSSQAGRYGVNVIGGNDPVIESVRMESNTTAAIRTNSDNTHIIDLWCELNGILIDTAATNTFLLGNYHSTCPVTDNSTAQSTTLFDPELDMLLRPPGYLEVRSDSSLHGTNLVVVDTVAQAAGTGPKLTFQGKYTNTGTIVEAGRITFENVTGTTGHYDFDTVFWNRLYGGAMAEKMRLKTTGTLAVSRFSAEKGTTLVAGDFALGNFGGTASVGTVTGTDQAGTFIVTALGAPGNPATVTLTFHDGTWTNSPICIANMATVAGTGASTYLMTDTTATTLVITYPALPVTTLTYPMAFNCMGR